ncbi:MAG: fructose-bisphosphatase [Proteobacteria bacterium ST_bin12]|nr:MAG: fructose-bisphosphatase [Proteobacteria bacterium ST_bin12]
MTQNMTISEFLAQHLQGEHADALGALLSDIEQAVKKIAIAIDEGAIAGNMGSLASENVQGEVQKTLDVITNDIFVEAVQASGYIAGMVSEEVIDPIKSKANKGNYLLCFDPLDGSSNVNVNISVGTIFSVLKANNNQPELADFLQAGTEQICAGYALYGTSTMLVFTTGNGVNGFTLDKKANQFVLTHPNMQIPQDTTEFAINMSNYRFWQEPVQRYIDECLQGTEGERDKDFNMRWVASMVAEVHRILVRGGVFMYPSDAKAKTGKLRLMYEANPMSFIVEQAGGGSTTGVQRVLEVNSTGIHQRVPIMLGSKNEIDRIASYHSTKKKKR